MIEDLGSSAEIDFSEAGERGHGSAMRFLRRWTRVWAIAFVAWTVLAFLSAAGAHVYTASMGSPESWAQLLAWNITISFVWSLLTPPIYALARRFTFERGNWPRMLPVHIAASVVFTLIAAYVIVWLEPYVTWTPQEHVPFVAHMLSRALMDLQRYWYILLITQAIAFYGKYRQRFLDQRAARAGADLALVEREHTKPSIALSKKSSSSATTSSKKMLGDLPPSSSVTGIRFCEAYCMISRPVVVSPVKAILAMRLLEASGLPASRPKPLTMLSTPGAAGRRSARSGPASEAGSARPA